MTYLYLYIFAHLLTAIAIAAWPKYPHPQSPCIGCRRDCPDRKEAARQ